MKICYFGKFENNPYAGLEEKPISQALKKLNNEVFELDVAESDAKEVIDEANKTDIFLFHNAGMNLGIEQNLGKLPFYTGLSGLYQLLQAIKPIKVIWYLDRIVGFGEEFMSTILPSIDFAFLNDDTWVRRHKWQNTYGFHQGTTERPLGQYRKDLACDIAFIGKIYGGRLEIISKIKQAYGGKFRIFNDIWGKDFDDLCQSAKIIFQPKWGMNDFCWSDQIYHTLSAGGFLLHPRLHGLKEEGFVDGEHFVGYTIEEELAAAIDFFIKPENDEKRKLVAQQGRKYVLDYFTWEMRLKEMLKIIKNNQIKK